MKLTTEMKLILKTAFASALATVVLLVAVLSVLSFVLNHTWNPFYKSNQQPFTVQGTGSVKAEPDAATISFTVTKTAADLKEAQNQANKATNAMVEAVVKLGVAKKDVKTSDYNSYPNYATQETTVGQPKLMMMPIKQDTQTIISYTVNENVSVSITDQNKVNEVIDAVTKLGAENVSGPNYTFSDEKQKSLQQEARLKAIADAKQKAKDLAEASGIRLGKLTSVQETNNYGGFVRPMMMDAKTAVGTTESAPTQINPGQDEVTDSVTLSYETY